MKNKIKTKDLVVGKVYQRDNFKPFFLISIEKMQFDHVWFKVKILISSEVNEGFMSDDCEFNELSY
jgi:hypothetical protein